MPAILALAEDPIPNIRFNVAKGLGKLAGPMKALNDEKIKHVLKRLEKDGDMDVRFFAQQSLQVL